MNQRILELMVKAGFDVEKLKMYPGGFPREDLLVLEDFAELIIEECAGLFTNVYVTIETEHGNIPVKPSEYIKKHFGLE